MAKSPHVRISVGDNSNVGNIIFESTIQNSLNTVSSSDASPDLKETLNQLIEAVGVMAKQLPQEISSEVADDLEKLVNESTKTKPNPKWYSVSLDGLVKAAENVGKIGLPVVQLAGKLLQLLTLSAGKQQS